MGRSLPTRNEHYEQEHTGETLHLEDSTPDLGARTRDSKQGSPHPNREGVPVRRRMVVAADDSALRETAVQMLREAEHEVWGAATWKDAWDLVRRRTPDCLLLDPRLGGGVEADRLLNLLTLEPTTRAMPVVTLSGDHSTVRAQIPSALPFHSLSLLLKPLGLDMVWQATQVAARAPAAVGWR